MWIFGQNTESPAQDAYSESEEEVTSDEEEDITSDEEEEVTSDKEEEESGVPVLDAYRERTLVFTSSKCPPGTGLDKSGELPYGFVWTPTCIDNEITIIECNSSLPPVLCMTCLAYFNPYCEVDYDKGLWTCPLCERTNVLPGEDLKPTFDALLEENMVEFHQSLDNESKDSDNSDDDSSYQDEGDTRTLILVVDSNLSGNDGKGVANALEEYLSSDPELYTRIGLVVFDETVSMYQLGLPGIASCDIYTPLDPEDDQALLDHKTSMEERAYLQDVYSTDDLDSLKQCLAATFGVSLDDDDYGRSEETPNRLDMLKRKRKDRLRKERHQRIGTKTKNNSSSESLWIKKKQESRIKRPKRCIGEAIQCAIDLTVVGHPDPSKTSQILLFTNGCPNLGGGSVVDTKEKQRMHDVVDMAMLEKAVEYFDTTASFALETGVGIDVFCAGVNQLGLPAYQALVEPSGGYVLSHLSLDSPQLKHNLNFVLQSTFMSRSFLSAGAEDSLILDSQVCLDIRTDSFITPSHVNGPGELIGDEFGLMENEHSAFSDALSLAVKEGFEPKKLPSTEVLDISMTRIKLGRVDPLATVALMMEVNDIFKKELDEYAFFQLVSRHVDRRGKKIITRVCTYRFSVADDVTDFVDSVDNEAVAVVLAKAAVYRSTHGREETEDVRDKVTAGDAEMMEKLAYETQLDIDATVQRVSSSFRLLNLETSINPKQSAGKKQQSSSLDFSFPPKLTEALGLLYHLRRGPLISPGPLRSIDDRAESRGLFSRLPLEDCINMMAPTLWSTGSLDKASKVDLNEMPAETLALWDHSIIAADGHDYLYLWSGKKCQGSDFEGIRRKFTKFLLKRSKNRFPMPQLATLVDGDSMSRRFTTELAPSHADTNEQQVANFPELEALSPEALKSLRSRFDFYDKSADASFRTWFWNVSSATNVSREDGMSLCD